MDFSSILIGNLDTFLIGILAVMMFFAFVWIPLKLLWKWVVS